MPLSGGQVRRRRAHEALERGGNSLDGGRPPLERAGTSLEGMPSPRAGRNLTRGGRLALERGGTSFEGAHIPRARRKFARVVSRPSSGAVFCSRVAGPSAWWAAGATRAMGLAVE
jgi:hypothetical protein